MTATLLASLLFGASVGSSGGGSQDARGLADRSITEYNAGDFDAALRDATRAYELSKAAGLLFNLGQCQRALHHWEQAAFSYRAFLREKPDAPNADEARALEAEMDAKAKAELEAQRPAPAAAPQPILVEAQPAAPGSQVPAAAVAAPPEPARKHSVPALAIAVGSVGLAAGITGAILAAVANGTRNGDAPPVGYSATSSTWDHTISQSAFNTANTEATAANILFYGGVALLVGGITWALLAPAPAEAAP